MTPVSKAFPKGAFLRSVLWAVLAASLAGGVSLLSRYLHTPLDLWPDLVCHSYLGWRVAAGDSLYIDLWDSHPPVAVLYSALIHLLAPPSMTTAYASALLLALMFGTAQGMMLHARGLRDARWIVPIAVLLAGAYSALFANARSEDMLMVLGTASVACAYAHSRNRGTRWAIAAGLLAALALFAKPAAIAPALVAFALVLHGRRGRGIAGFCAAGAVVGLAFLAYFLDDDRYVMFIDGVVRYGRAYFRPITPEIVGEGLWASLASPKPFLVTTPFFIALFLVAAVCALPWLRRDRVRIALLAAWPVLELLMALLQTTYYHYVFYPFQASLLTVAFAMTVSPLVPVSAGGTQPPRSSRMHTSLMLAGVLAMCVGTFALASQAASARADYFADRNVALIEFSGVLKRHRATYSGEMLWLDAAPAFGYLAGVRQVIPEYLGSPLFNANYADNRRWARAGNGLDRIKLLIVWNEWFDLDRQGSDIAAYPAYAAFRHEVHASFDDIGDFGLYKRRGPVTVYVRKGDLPEIRRDLSSLKSKID